uniref:hypothetical protein n=1 Tax=uncultured Tenacibaculum sp. TaxID=174713 RepID=UPI00262608AD|nr:hypothetical protein [uncultured Tenacibaculum sp.]
MNSRCLIFLISILLATSCDFFSYSKTGKLQAVDTIVDFTRVDVSPAFSKCKNLLDAAKANCFREEIHTRVANSLQEHQFVTDIGIDEEVVIDVLIDAEGKCRLKNITASETITEELPELENLIKSAIEKLPQIQPATKRGIPVVTQYHLPLKIQTK